MLRKKRIGKKGQVTIPEDIREKFGLKEGSKVSFAVRKDEIVVKPEEREKKFVENWCSIVKKKLENPINLKEEFYEQIEEDVLL